MNTNLTLCRHWAKLCVAICQHCFIKEQNRNKDEVGSKFFHDHLFVPRVYLQCHPLSGELKFLINYQLCLPSEDCWNVPLWLHCVARLFFTQLIIIRYLSILSQYNKSCSSTTLIIIHRFVSVNFVCCRSTPWCDWAKNLKFSHSHKIKWSPLCIGCLFMLIRILPVYQIFERENLNVQNRDLLLILHPYKWDNNNACSSPCAYI